MKKVAVVIPNYNGMKFVKTCLDSVEEQNYDDLEIIVVDNYSTDGSYEFIKENYPDVILKRMDKNYGFSIAVNTGIKMADSEYVLLLNNDTEVDENFVSELVSKIDSDKNIFSCSAKMINYYDREIMDDAGDLYTILGWAFQRGIGRSIEEYCYEKDVFASCAGAAIYRKELFDKVGLFDEMHFAYLEDIDVGYRARILGYRNVYHPRAKVYHMGSATSGSKYNSFKVKLSARNNIYLVYKNTPAWQAILNFPFLCLGFGVKYSFFKKIGFDKDYVDGLKEAFKTLYKCKRVKFDSEKHKNCLGLEIEMIMATFQYAVDYMKRHI